MTAPASHHSRTLAPPERSCFTCAHSPPPGHPAGCSALIVGDEGDPVHDGIVDYCEASGANAEDNAAPGWPLLRTIACPAWKSR